MFFSVFFLIYAGLCFYIGIRFFAFLLYFFPGLKAYIFWPVFALLCCLLTSGSFTNHNILFYRKICSLWMAVFMYMFLLLAVFDFVKLLLHLFKKNIPNIHVYLTGEAIFLCALIIIFGMIHARSIKTVNYELTLNGSHGSIRAALISDLHIGHNIGEVWIGKVADAVNIQQPDIVFITGDIFDGNLDVIKDIPAFTEQLKRISAPLGVFACLGNHDVDRFSIRGASADRIAGILKDAGITVLQDEVYEIWKNMYIAGRRDARPIGMDAERKSADELLAGFDGTIIVLDHQPTEFPLLEKAGAALVLSGHTHKGQLFPGALITRPMFKKMGAADYGYWKGQSMQGVITSGAGVWGPPVRVGTNNEIAIIEIKFVRR